MEGFFFKGSRFFLVDVKSPGVREFSLSAWPGVEHQLKRKSQMRGGVPGGDGNSKN